MGFGGGEFKNTKNITIMKKFIIIIISFSLIISAKSQSKKSFDNKKLINGYSRATSIDICPKKLRVENYVNDKLSEWQQKSKYENTEDYKNRVSETNRQKKIDYYTNEIINKLAKNDIVLKSISNEYDPDNEVFKMYFAQLTPIYVKVPKNEAESFDKNNNSLEYKNTDYTLTKDEKYALLYVEVVNTENKKKYIFDSNKPVIFKLTKVEYNFDRVEIEVKDMDEIIQVDEPIKTISIGKSDVDVNIPETYTKKENTYALIIGNEDYSSYQTDLKSEVNVNYAVNDAYTFKEYVVKTIGVPKKQVFLLTNATAGQIYQGIAKLNTLAEIKEGKAELIFYYAGHGLPDEKTKEPYIMPVDVSGSDLQYAIKLNDVYKKLTEFPVKRVTVILDACFSGGARNQGLLAMRGIKIIPKENYLSGKIIIMASSSADESSGAYEEKEHGLFTYFLLKKLQETKGDITYKELMDYITEKVKEESVLVNNKLQTPRIQTSDKVKDIWEVWKIK